jgi:hypothetical protein
LCELETVGRSVEPGDQYAQRDEDEDELKKKSGQAWPSLRATPSESTAGKCDTAQRMPRGSTAGSGLKRVSMRG